MPKIPYQFVQEQYSYPEQYSESYGSYASVSMGSPIIGLAIPSKGPGTTPVTTCTVTNTGNGPITFDIQGTHYPKGTPQGGQYTQVPTNRIANETLAAGASKNYTLTAPNVDSNWVNGDWKTQVGCFLPGTSTPVTGGLSAFLDPSFTVTVVTGVSITALVVT